MTIYDWKNKYLPPAVVRDADGNEWPKVVRLQTETGRIVQLTEKICGDEPETIERQISTPVSVEFIIDAPEDKAMNLLEEAFDNLDDDLFHVHIDQWEKLAHAAFEVLKSHGREKS